jgi:hypothetical protein
MKHRRSLMLRFLFLFFPCVLLAQLPETDLWLFKLKFEKGIPKIDGGKNITARAGYDNQPSFTPDNKGILYVSIRDDKQADVYRYEISKNISTQLTKTKESEYSPNFTSTGSEISCVVVEADSTQRLWLYNPDGSVKRCYHEGIDSIGYYSWLSADTLLYYKLTAPHSLRMYAERSKEDKWICSHPSRAFKKTNGSSFIYAIKDSTNIQYRIYDTRVKRSDLYAVHQNSASEDFVWHPTMGLLKSEGNTILKYDEATKSWQVIYDLSTYGIKKITRFAISAKDKYLVIVDNT